MRRVNRQRLCPVCEKHDWCLVAEDGSAAICARVSDGSTKRVGDAGWLHQLRPGAIPRPPRRVEAAARPAVDCEKLMQQYRERISRRQVAMLARALGVSAASLDRLSVGWDGEAFAFPMRDADGQVIGIRRRFSSGKKVCVPGSRNGLFIPEGLTGKGVLVICEGPTDCAAALDLGFEAIGRPNCNSKVRMTVRYAGGREAIVVADNDVVGIAGARILADALTARGSRVRVVVPPAGVKDLRDWARQGLTAGGLINAQ